MHVQVHRWCDWYRRMNRPHLISQPEDWIYFLLDVGVQPVLKGSLQLMLQQYVAF